MNLSANKPVNTAVRKIIFAGIVLLAIWLILTVLRYNIPENAIVLLNERSGGQEDIPKVSLDSGTWDWDTSIWNGEPVSERADKLGETLIYLSVYGLLSLSVAAVLLYLGTLITRVTGRPSWLARLRSILRNILVSSGISVPVFAVSSIVTLSVITAYDSASSGPPPFWDFWSIFISVIVPVFLLIHVGYNEMVKQTGTETPILIRNVAVKMVVSLLRMTGLMLVISILRVPTSPGLGLVMRDSLLMRDYPVIFAIAWIFVIIIVLAKLLADLIEIIYIRYSGLDAAADEIDEQEPVRSGIPRGWLIFCLIITGVTILIAVFGPMLAPYGYNEIILADRMAEPSAQHLLGTDNLGRDILSRLIYGIRMDIFAGLTCAGILAIVASGWALLANKVKTMNERLGNILEDLVLLPVRIVSAFPWLLLLTMISALYVLNLETFAITLVTFLVLLPRAVVMILEMYRSIPEKKGILYNLIKVLPAVLVFIVPGSILYLSTASYLGLGIAPPLPELGILLTGTGIQYFLKAPWMSVVPSICLIVVLTIWVMTGNALLEKTGFRSRSLWVKIIE